MPTESPQSYRDLVNDILAKNINKYSEEIDLHFFPTLYLEEEIGKVNSDLTIIQNENQELTAVFLNAADQKLRNKYLSVEDLCENYVEEKLAHSTNARNILPIIIALYRTRTWLGEKLATLGLEGETSATNDTLEITQVEEQEESDLSKGEYTLARRILIIKYLFEKGLENTKLANRPINYSAMGRFIDFMVSTGTGPEEIRGGYLQKMVSKIWQKGSKYEADLVFVADQFEKIGLNNIAMEIKQDIKSKNSDKM
jgi:hypothetical protein